MILVLFISLHLFLVHKTFFIDADGSMKVAIAGYGDIPFHMTQVSKFGFTDMFDLNEPLFTGEKIRYAFFINWLGGIFMRMTDSWPIALHLPTMAALIASYILIFLAYRNILGKRWAALLAVIMFMLGSGLGAWPHIKEHLLPNVFNFRPFIDYLVDNNISTVSWWKAVYPEQNISWGGAMSLVFLHQRAFFFGLFLFSVVIYALSRYPNFENKKWRWLAGIALGLGPLGHYHTFLVLCLVLGFYFVISLLRKNWILVRSLLYVAVVAGVIALPQILYILSGPDPISSDNQSFINFRLGWMVEPTIGSVKYPDGVDLNFVDKFLTYLKFLWVNFGLILPLLALSFLHKPLRRGSGLPVLWFGVLLFAFVQTVRTQPWDYDTNKILVYFAFFASAAIIKFLISCIERRKIIGMMLLAVSFVFVIFSGVVDILPRAFVPIDKMPVIFNRDAIRTAYFIRQNVEAADIIITSSTHLNIVSSLAGRPTIVGFPGWLWTKGVSYGAREADLRMFYLDPVKNKNIAAKYKAQYVLIDPTITYDWKADKKIFDNNFKLIFKAGSYYLYYLEE